VDFMSLNYKNIKTPKSNCLSKRQCFFKKLI
jgi:hypothetical protein